MIQCPAGSIDKVLPVEGIGDDIRDENQVKE